LNRVSTLEELRDLRAEMLDRFGPLPPEAEQLVREMELRILAHRWGVDGVRVEDRFLVLTYTDRPRIEALAARYPGGVRVVDHRSAYVPLPKGLANAVALVELAKQVLSAEATRRYTPARQ
jgi:transcription-repair coupling factor (superfamily II helicase)